MPTIAICGEKDEFIIEIGKYMKQLKEISTK